MKFVLTGITLPLDATSDDLKDKIARSIRQEPSLFTYSIIKKAIDARKGEVNFVYNVVIESGSYINARNCRPYEEPKPLKIGKYAYTDRPVVVGFGPAGIFASLVLARSGAKPIVLERGKNVNEREKDVETLKKKGILNPESNICFGEGGAGTFSDGKLNTGVNSEWTSFILHEFVKHGAKEDILTDSLPHIGSDYLRNVVKSFREEIISLGGEILFESRFNGCQTEKGQVKGATYLDKDNVSHSISTSHVILALGHSPLDTMQILLKQGLLVEPKDFSIGVRIEHLQKDINAACYHSQAKNPLLPAAPYKGVVHLNSGRSVYTFCNCPGGYVFNSSSEENTVLTNGMSNNARDGKNGNSALLVNVKVDDYFHGNPLDGFSYRQTLERLAFCKEKPYFAPIMKLSDFENDRVSTSLGDVNPTYEPGVYFASFRKILPPYIYDSLLSSISYFKTHLSFFKDEDAILTGFETRSSSPVRIPRDEKFMSNLVGLYPAGEGASYAGGITSAALDGLKVALSLLK
jgi:uncharacterized FAD-dependent dehydrogenase